VRPFPITFGIPPQSGEGERESGWRVGRGEGKTKILDGHGGVRYALAHSITDATNPAIESKLSPAIAIRQMGHFVVQRLLLPDLRALLARLNRNIKPPVTMKRTVKPNAIIHQSKPLNTSPQCASRQVRSRQYAIKRTSAARSTVLGFMLLCAALQSEKRDRIGT